MGKLDEKVAIITGASGGIGAATARVFVEEGARVMLVDLDREALAEIAEELGEEVAAYEVADVSDAEQVRGYVDATVERFGGVDILFDNAGIEGSVAPLVELDEEDFQRVLDVNLKGAWLGLKYAAPKILERGGGSILITSSVAGLVGAAGLGAYVSSKHGVMGLMKSAAQELGPQGVRVNCINPGPIENRMMRSIEEQAAPDNPEAVKSQYSQMIPLQRYGTNEEVAHLAAFLVSDEAGYCNGNAYVVDGGMMAT